MTQTALVCPNHRLSHYAQATKSSCWGFCMTEIVRGECLCLHSCASNPVVQQMCNVGVVSQCLVSTATDGNNRNNNSIQNTFLRIWPPKYPRGQNDPAWAARCDWRFLKWTCERAAELICLHLHHHFSSSVGGSLHPLTRFLCCVPYIDAFQDNAFGFSLD